MKTNIATGFLLLIGLTALGCGGGGSDNTPRFVGGLWTGALTENSDTCSPAAGTTLNITHQVNQNGDAVVLVDQAGVQYIGSIVGDDGFSVDAQSATAGQPSCVDATRIRYQSIDQDTDNTADVEITISRTCGTNTCQIDYKGTALRTSSNVTPATTPTMTPTRTGG